MVAKHLLPVAEHQEVKRYFQHITIAFEQQTILGHYQLKRPGIIHHILIYIRNVLLYPLSAPGARLKPGPYPYNGLTYFVQTFTQVGHLHPVDISRLLPIGNNDYFIKNLFFMLIKQHPVNEIESLIHYKRLRKRAAAQVMYRTNPQTEKQFVFWQVDINNRCIPAC